MERSIPERVARLEATVKSEKERSERIESKLDKLLWLTITTLLAVVGALLRGQAG